MFSFLQQKRCIFSLLVLSFVGLMSLAQPVMAQCPGTPSATTVVYQGCAEVTGAGTSILVTQPTGAVVGDLLLLSISTDGSTTPTPSLATGWTQLGTTRNTQDVTNSLWYRTTLTTTAANRTFNLGANEDYVATFMRFSNAESLFATFASGSGDPVSPTLTTDRANTLVLRLSAKDRRDTNLNGGGLTQITTSGAGNGNGSMDTAIGYINYPTSGTNVGSYAFSDSNDDGWHAVTIAIRPPLPAVAFRITHSGATGSTCTPTTITYTAVNALGGTVTNFTGALTLGATTGGIANGNWAAFGDQQGVTFNNGTANNGSATYTMVAADAGTVQFNYTPNRAGTTIFTVASGGINQGSHAQGSTQNLTANLCGFTIGHDGTHGSCLAAGYQEILVSAVQSNGSTVRTTYTGTVTINTSTTAGVWTRTAVGGESFGTINSQSNGNISYTFAAADAGTAILRFTHVGVNNVSPGVNFDIFDSVVPSVDALLAENNLSITACGFSITHDGDAPNCSYELITLSSTQVGNTNTITVTTSTTGGTWVPESTAGTYSPLANGNFSYAFTAVESVATFRLFHPATGTVTFDINDMSGDVQVGVDDPLDVGACEFVFTAPGSGNNCTPTNITLTVMDQGMGLVAGYTGTVTLSTSSGVGVWGQGTATNVPNNSPSVGNGVATLVFGAADAGSVDITLSHDDPDNMLMLNATDSSLGLVTPGQPTVNMRACSFWVSVTSPGDTCTPNDITIEVRDTASNLVSNFVGTATISTTFNNGDWALNGATNTVTFTNFGSGGAQYYFGPSAGGSVTLTFTDPIVETTKIIVQDGSGLVSVDAGHNPDLVIQACRFLISHAGNSDLCTPASVTFSLVDSSDNPVNDYEGEIFISTSNPGTWTDGATSGIVDTGGGSANYQFVVPNTGTVTFTFQGLAIDTYDIDITDGSNSDNDGDPTDDPELEFTACLPKITGFSCVNAATASITLPDSAESFGSRAVVMVTGNEGTTAITNAQFDGVNASASGQLLTVANNSNPGNQRTITEMFTWLDAELPSAAGTYNGTFTTDDGQAMCLIALKNVNQSYPAGAQLGSAFNDGGTIQSSLTSPAIDSIVISGVTVDENNGTFAVNTLGNQLANINVADDNWTFATGWGTTANTGTVTVTESYSGTTDKWTHAIAAFAPAPAPLSYFHITHDNSTTSCTKQQVMITAYDINGNIKNNYTGTITISTDQNHGTWSQSPATGVLTENPLDDNGTATYQFAASDNGSVTLSFLNPHNEVIEFEVVDGSVSDDGTHSPLTVTSCEPIISDTQCYAGTSGSIDIVGSNTSAARAVVMSIARESTVGNDPAIDSSLVLFDTGGSPMTMSPVVSAKVNNGSLVNTTEMYVIFDANLPTAAGTYNASFTELSGTFPNTPGMCLTSFYGVAQTVPVAPAVAATTSVVTVTPASATTTVTTAGNNALVLSVASDDRTGGSYSSDFDNTLWNNTSPPTSAVFSGFYSIKAQAGPVVDTVVPTGAPQIMTHIMAAFSPVVAGPPTADDFVPVTLFKTFSGPINYRAYGSSYRTLPNNNGVDACTFEDSAVGTSLTVDIPAGSTFKGAYLYWSGDGDEDISPLQIDDQVTLVRGTQTFSINADEIFQINNVGSNNNLDYFTGYKDVTTIVNTNGTYTLRDLTSQNGLPWQQTSACAAGWALVVVYENALEDIQVINLFHGFQPFQDSSFELVPRNFRIRANEPGLPHGQLTHITIEGDDSPALNGANERLGLQAAPGSTAFNYLTNSFNPSGAQYNSTVTRPIYDSLLVWSPTAGVNMDGYEALSLTSWGVDVDTHFLRGDVISTPLYEFGIADPQPEHITTEYSAGQDLVLLVGEVISVTNAPIVDLEVTLVEGATFIAGGTSTYTIQTINNGDGTGGFGDMTGSATVTVTFPSGISVITGTVTASGWNCVINNSPPANPLGLAALACKYDISTPLVEGGSLPDITVPVALADESVFPNLVNQRKVIVRALYHGGNCLPDPLDDSLVDFGTSPDPADCDISPEFDNVQDLEGGAVSMNDLEEKSVNNNNVDSVTTTINGPLTNLALTKVAGTFQEASMATYTITVTNLGPQPATKLMTVTDTLPAGLTWDQVAFDNGGDPQGDWSCTAAGQNVTCTSGTDLAVGTAIDFFIPVILSAPAIENATVNNTACVAIATGNFDTISGNNCDLEPVTVQGEPVAAQNKFLISLNLAGSLGSGSGTVTFEPDDIILYDPVTDIGTMFLDDSADNSDGLQDINALHVRKNGHIILSAVTGTSTIGVLPTQVTFEPGDLVVYDPILKEATLLFDGSAHFDSPTTNIDAVFEQDNGLLVISTTDSASMHAGTVWERGDWVRFDPSQPTPTATIFLDGQSDVFTADVQLNGTYFKVGGTPDYVITIGQTNATIATGSTSMTGDDIASIQPGVSSQLEFRGSVPNGVFDPLSSARFIDGVHIVEDGYFGHFSIAQSVSGNTCTPTMFTVTKHSFSHALDTTYTGSIVIDMNYAGTATLTVSTGGGDLDNPSGNQYIYTFEPGDMGVAEFSLTVPDDGVNINIDVSNGLRRESGGEDPTLSFNDVNSIVTYGDNFSSNNYTGSSGLSNWNGDWIETDPVGSNNHSDGNVRVLVEEVYFDNTPSTVDNDSGTFDESMPALTRNVDLSLYDIADPLVLTFDWRTVSVNAGDVFIVEVKGDTTTGNPWLEVDTFTGLVNTNSDSETYNLSTILSAGSQDVSEFTGIRFRVDNNYDVSGNFIIDDVLLTTSTTDCGVGSVHHYDIIHGGNGVMCQAYPIQFVAHDIAHTPVAPGLNTMVTLNTSTGSGDWFDSGAFAITDITPGDGQATYTFGVAQNTFTALFNLTSVATLSQTISFNINQALVTELEDPPFTFYKSGFIFKDSPATVGNVVQGMDIGTQIAGKPSGTLPSNPIYIMAVDSSEGPGGETLPVCTALFSGETVTIQIEAQCVDPASCSQAVELDSQTIATHPNYIPGSPGPGTAKTNLDVDFDANGAAELDFVYPDVGQITLHAEYEIPLRNIGDTGDGDFLLSGDDMVGSSNPFVVRPFGFNIDLGPGTSTATTTAGPVFRRAGETFPVNIQAVTWDADDDLDNDGYPDESADLAAGNVVTPNFGFESITPTVTLSHSVFLPMTPTIGTLGGTTSFGNFAGGEEEQTDISYSEVGIINLLAELDGNNYMNSAGPVTGTRLNVGRFTPFYYRLTNPVHTNRFDLSGFCSPSSSFTYMGEALQVTFDVEAINAAEAITANYFDGFEKLTDVSTQFFFYATDLDTMTTLTDRIDATGANAVVWNDFSSMQTGTGTVTATIILEKGSSPDGPFNMFALGTIPVDSDGITALPSQLTLNAGGTSTVSVIPGTTSMRYGRLTINSTGGSEISISNTPGAGLDIPITFDLEYYESDVDNFLVNPLDDCTSLTSANLSLITNSYTDGLANDGIGPDIVTTSPTVTIGIQSPTITVLANGGTRSSTSGPDIPLYLSSPFPGDATATAIGSVLLEMDLDAAVDIDNDMTDDVTYEYLKFNWRSPGDLYTETPDTPLPGDDDNPRAIIDFGAFQGNRRVINWQEILLTPE